MSDPTSLRVASAETVAMSTTSAQSATIGAAGQDFDVEIIRVICDADVWLEFGENPTAVAESAGAIKLIANTVEYFDIRAGHKVAGILASGTGKLNIARMR